MILGALAAMSSTVAAQAPNSLMYQGRLTTSAGAAITAATNVTFAIYAAASGGTALWSSGTVSVTPDQNGVFTVELTAIPTSVFNGSRRYIGITVAGDTEMTPRQLLTSAPYAYNTITAPGLAFVTSLPANNYRPIPSGTTALDSISVTVPGPGYVYIIARTDFYMNHTSGTADEFYFQVGPTAGVISFSQYGFGHVTIPGGAATGVYKMPVDGQKPFQVSSAGTVKYYVNCRVQSGYDVSDGFYNLQLTGMYFPQSAGSIALPAAIEGDNDAGEAGNRQ
jgi:hypothetical protein